MRLFISNFKILLIFLITAILLIVYSLFLKYQNIDIVIAQSQFQDNKIRLEKYLFRVKPCSKVLTGSSLAFRLNPIDLGEDFCNLSFAGDSSITGLEILKRDNADVKLVLIEINVLKDEDKFLIDSSDGIIFNLKNTFLFFQDRYQPATLLVNFLKRKGNNPPAAPTEEQFKFWLEKQRHEYSNISDNYQQEMLRQFNKIKSQLGLLKQKNIQYKFVELPMHKDILGSAKHLFLVNKVQELFPEVDLIRAGENAHYITDDGIHLSHDSAQKFSNFLMNAAK